MGGNGGESWIRTEGVDDWESREEKIVGWMRWGYGSFLAGSFVEMG